MTQRLPPLAKAQIRELKRRVADLRDPVRYLVVKQIGSRFAMYYDASDGLYGMNEQAEALKRRTKQFALDVISLVRTFPPGEPSWTVGGQLTHPTKPDSGSKL